MGLVVKFGFILAFLALGVGLRAAGLLPGRRRDRLDAVAFYVALPSLVFVSTYGQSLGRLVSVPLLAGYWTTLVATLALAWVVHRRVAPASVRSVAMVQSYHCNLGYLGLPIVASAFGALTTAKASVVLGVATLTQVPLTVFLFTTVTDADRPLGEEMLTLASNPILLSLAAGLALGPAGVDVPDPVLDALGAVSELALPLALLGVGGALTVGSDVDLGRTLASTVALKVVAMPVLALGVYWLLDPAPSTLRAGVVMLGMPAAVSTYVYASELGGDRTFASLAVFTSTVASTGTLFVLLTVLD